MDTKKLRQKILDLAIRGKLVPQDPNDEPASVLLERIKEEKERLIKEGKIKKSKKTVSSDTPHYPYLLPNGWEWCRLNEIAESSLGKTLDKSRNTGKVYPYLCAINVKWNDFDLSVVKTIKLEDNEKERYQVLKGDLLICEGGDVGRSAIWDSNEPIYYQNALHRVRFFDNIVADFYLYLIWCYKNYNWIDDICNGVTIKHFTQDKINALYFPLPPVAEQQRIVAEIKRWFALIDQIEQGKSNLQTTIRQAKSKILDLAIHGKLVPQDPNDEPAIELLKRINPNFTPCDNGHSEKLPQNWVWVKGKNIFFPMKSTKPKNNEFQYIDIDSIDNKQQIINEIKTIKTSNAPSRASRYTQKNDVIFSMVRPYLRNIAKVVTDNCIASTGFYVCSAIPQILNSNYCYYLMISDYVVNGLNQFMKGDNSPSINKGHIDEWLFPLPPLTEQQRIVQKIEELFSVLDNIQNALEV